MPMDAESFKNIWKNYIQKLPKEKTCLVRKLIKNILTSYKVRLLM